MGSDGGHTWSELDVVEDLPDGPQDDECFGLFGGLARLPVPDRDVLIFSNCDHTEWRQTGAVWASLDGGQTWPHIRHIFGEESFAYSSLYAGRVGTPSEGWIYCFFEQTDFGPGNGHLARFNLAWLVRGHAASLGPAAHYETQASPARHLKIQQNAPFTEKRIRIEVTDSRGRPVEDVAVMLSGQWLAASTDASGCAHFSLNPTPSATAPDVELRLCKRGYATQSLTIRKR